MEYVCYCSKVTEADIMRAIEEDGTRSLAEVIQVTGAMQEPNCAVNNPQGVCCYMDFAAVYDKLLGKACNHAKEPPSCKTCCGCK
jgi:bacterioferritin-associated ferredoxin